MRAGRFSLAIVAAFCAAMSPAIAQPNTEFARANEHYAQGHFQEAVQGYENLVRAREWNAPLFYDLGNAYFRSGDTARAILNYERALTLQRNHPEATANLAVARDKERALELQKSRGERLLNFATPTQLTIAAAVAFWIAAFAVVTLVFNSRRSSKAVIVAISAMVVFGIALACLVRIHNASKGLAIITAETIDARIATADNANSVLALPPGSEVRILSQRGDWIYAVLPNNLRGWIPAKSVEAVRL